MDRKRIVVMGFMANIPIAGVVWQHVHYIVALQRLGHEVYYIEDTNRCPYDPVAAEITDDYSFATKKLARLAEQFGFEGRWAYCAAFLPDRPCYGMSQERISELLRTADAILNICGAQEITDELRAGGPMIYVESDPGVEQIRVDKGEKPPLDYLSAHHALFTFGENVGRPEFPVPLHGFRWQPTRQPVVTDFWKTDTLPPSAAVFTSVANWNTSNLKDIEWRGDRFLWSKTREFLRFIDAPVVAGESFELATNLRDPDTIEQLRARHWQLISPDEMSVDHDLYRRYLQNSKGEFTVAKDQYIRLHTGWFSDRSACYLAAGRPVITQETGFTRLFGGKCGLFAFESLEQIGEAVREINADYSKHSRAAREIAEEFFEATKVVASLLDRAGI